MAVTSHRQGHQVLCDDDGICRYVDTGELADHDRPCIRCGKLPTPEGYDACLGFVFGVVSACCGHGVAEPYTLSRYIDLSPEAQGEVE